VDDCLLVGGSPSDKLAAANLLDPGSLSFTLEEETCLDRDEEGSLPFLDMRLSHAHNGVMTRWYRKPTDTGLLLSAKSLAPRSFKRGMVIGGFHRIFNVSPTREVFLEGVEEFRGILMTNGYSSNEINTWLAEFTAKKEAAAEDEVESDADVADTIFTRLQYRGRETDRLIRKLQQRVPSGKHVKFVRFTHKLSACLPSLKPRLKEAHESGVVYKIRCAACSAAYVGRTRRHLVTRFTEHRREGTPVSKHFSECGSPLNLQSLSVLSRTDLPAQLPALEALYIKWLTPRINIQHKVEDVHGLKVINPVKPKIREIPYQF